MSFELIKQRHTVYLMTAVLVTALAVVMNQTDIPQVTFSEYSNNDDSAVISEKVVEINDTLILASKGTDLVSSLTGTHHGVRLKSRNQKLIVTASLKDLFDYYLSAAGEESTEDIDQRIKQELARQLDAEAEALAQAMSIWHDYLTYKNELVEFDQQYSAHSSQPEKSKQLQLLQQRQLALIALQDQIFGAKIAQVLFNFDRQLDGHTLEKAELLASDLSAEQIQQRLINLSAQLPIETVVSLQRNNQQKALVEIDRQEGLSAQQKYQKREQQVGSAAASRLQVLDEKRAVWKTKMLIFKQQKEQLEQAGLAQEEYIISLDKLYGQHFAPEERLRARALSSNRE
jgi:lipase chaperone LimK